MHITIIIAVHIRRIKMALLLLLYLDNTIMYKTNW